MSLDAGTALERFALWYGIDISALAGPVTVLCRFFDHILCSKGNEPWAQAGRMNFAKMRCG
jgi:hypothetical protein